MTVIAPFIRVAPDGRTFTTRGLAAGTESRGKTTWKILATLMIAVALFSRLTYLIKPWDHDARIFIYLGKLIDDGGRYCHDIIDNKFPSVGLMTSAAYRAFGVHWWPYVILQTMLAMTSCLLLGRSAARAFGEYARHSTILYAMVYLNLNALVFGGFQLETLQIFFAVLAAGAALEALRNGRGINAFAAGLAAGTAMMLKPTGASVLAAFAIASIVASWRKPGKLFIHGALAACGVAIPIAVTLIYIIQTDILRDMPALYRQIARYANETPWELLDLAKIGVVVVMGGFPLFVRGWIFRRAEHRADDANLSPGLVTFAIAWLVLELLGVILQRRMYAYHFLVVAAPAALVYGMLPRRDRALQLAAALIPATVLSLTGAKMTIQECWPPKYRMAVSDYIAAHTTPSDSVWQDSTPRLLLETGCKPGSKITLTFLFFNYDTAPIEYTNILLSDFADRKPKYIVLPTDVAKKVQVEMGRSPEMGRLPVREENYRAAWMRIEDWVKSHYAAETVIEKETVWRRKDDVLTRGGR